MKTEDSGQEAFEKRARELLEESTQRLDGRVRSRLTQARFAAVEEARRARHPFAWRTWVPGRCARRCSGAGSGAVERPFGATARGVLARPSLDDLEIVAGGENFELLENLDFYEWVSTQGSPDIG